MFFKSRIPFVQILLYLYLLLMVDLLLNLFDIFAVDSVLIGFCGILINFFLEVLIM